MKSPQKLFCKIGIPTVKIQILGRDLQCRDMQPLIHKAALTVLDVDPHRIGLAPGDIVELQPEIDGSVTAYLSRRSNLPFGIGKPCLRRMGTLGPKATALIFRALTVSARLRVRVADIEFAHLSSRGRNSVSISVWGDPADLGLAV